MVFKNNIFSSSFFNRFVAGLTLTVMTISTMPAIPLPNPGGSVKGFDKELFNYHFTRADRETNIHDWMNKAKQGLLIAHTSWEQIALELYNDPDDFNTAKQMMSEWEQAELEEQFVKWIEKKYISEAQNELIINSSVETYNQNLKYMFKTDDDGKILYDEITGDPLVYRPGERDIDSDTENFKNSISVKNNEIIDIYQTNIEYSFPEILVYFGSENNLQDKFSGMKIRSGNNLRFESMNIAMREGQIFRNRRTNDIWSERKKTEKEAAESITEELIIATKTYCDEGTRLLEERIESAKAGTSDLALEGQDWLAQYQEQFNRGLSAWQESEEKFFIQRIEWEQSAGKQFAEGEQAWSQAFQTMIEKRQEWELKSKKLFEDGMLVFQNVSDELNKTIEKVRAEYEKDAALRIQTGSQRACAWLNTYLTSAGVVASSQENINFWALDITDDVDAIPSLKSGNLRNWLSQKATEIIQSDLSNDERSRKNTAIAEMRNWADLYDTYLTKAIEARNALINDFNLVIGNGKLIDVLNDNISSEDFYLDEYQIELLRSKAVLGYWEKRVEIAKAVNDYAVELSAGRITNAEGVKQWEDAKNEYETALAIYEQCQTELEIAGNEVNEKKAALNNAEIALNEVNEKLNSLNSEYSVLVAMSLMNDKEFMLYQIADKYKELLKIHNQLSSNTTDLVYLNYLEKYQELGFAGKLEEGSNLIKTLIEGSEKEKSLSELREDYESIVISESEEILFVDINEYGLKEESLYFYVLNELFNQEEKDKELIFKTVQAAKRAIETEIEGRQSIIRLLACDSIEEWYLQEKGITEDDLPETLAEEGLEYQLTKDAEESSLELEAAKTELNGQGLSDLACLILLDDLIQKNGKNRNLLAAYNYAKWYSAPLINENKNKFIENLNNVFEEYNISGTNEIIPDAEDIANKIIYLDGDIAENVSRFLEKIDSVKTAVPFWLKDEYENWESMFYDYIVSLAINKNIYSSLDINELLEEYNDLINSAPVEVDDEYEKRIKTIQYEIIFLENYTKRKENYEQDNEDKYWRSFLNSEILKIYIDEQVRDKTDKTFNIEIESISDRKNGSIKDKLELLNFQAGILNHGLKMDFSSETKRLLGKYKTLANTFLEDDTKEWDEESAIKAGNIYTQSANAETSKISQLLNNYTYFQNEITELAGAFLLAKSDNELNKKMLEIEKDITDNRATYTLKLNEYKNKADEFKNTGVRYDALYSEAKNAYKTMEDSRLEYEKMDGIRRWASTAYLYNEQNTDLQLAYYKQPAEELKFSLEKYNKAQIVIDVLKNLYNANSTERPYEDTDYNRIYQEYKISFERMINIMQMKDKLEAEIKKEVQNNDNLYGVYSEAVRELGHPLQVPKIEETPVERSEYSLINLLTVDNGRLVFSIDSSFRIKTQTSDDINKLNTYFEAVDKVDNETYKASVFEQQLRDLNTYMMQNITSFEKYQQWSLASNFLLLELKKANGDIGIANDFYQREQGLASSNLSGMNATYSDSRYHSVSDNRMSDTTMEAIFRASWQAMSAEDREYLETYTILVLSGGGGLQSNFFKDAANLRETTFMESSARSSANYHYGIAENARNLALATLLFLPTTATALFITAGVNYDIERTLRVTEHEIAILRNVYFNRTIAGFTGLLTTENKVDESLDKYLKSCERLAKLKGEVKSGEKVEWVDILTSFSTAEIYEADSNELVELKSYWDSMNADHNFNYTSVQDALKSLVQWSKAKREDTKEKLETEWNGDEIQRQNNTAALRAITNSFINDVETIYNINDLKEAAKNSFGKTTASEKTHINNIEKVLIKEISGLTDNGSAFENEYLNLSYELTDVITRAYQSRYYSELETRIFEWQLKQNEINQKQRAWQEAAVLILERGREDWKKGAEKIQEEYILWRKQWQEKYNKEKINWDNAYLQGLQDKAQWVAMATNAANSASTGAMLEFIAADAETKSRMFDISYSSIIGEVNNILDVQKTLNEILNMAGITGLENSFNAINNSANTISTKLQTGTGGINLWNTFDVKYNAFKMTDEANKDLADREAKKIAANAKRLAEKALENLKLNVDSANKSFDESMDETFLLNRWDRSGNMYIKDVIVHSTLTEKAIKEHVVVESYRYYQLEPIELKTDLREENLLQYDSFVVEALINNMYKEFEGIVEGIFGKTGEGKITKTIEKIVHKQRSEPIERVDEDGNKYTSYKTYYEDILVKTDVTESPGKFGAWIGYAGKSINDEVAGGVWIGGAGELGRLISNFDRWNEKEGKGIQALNLAEWEKALWDDRDSWFKAPSLKVISDIAMTITAAVVSVVLTPFTGGASLGIMLGVAALTTGISMTDDLVFMLLDGAGGYKEWDELAVNYALKATTSFATSVAGGMLNGVGSVAQGASAGLTGVNKFLVEGGLTGLVTKGTEGIGKTIAETAMKGVTSIITSSISSPLSAITYTHNDGFGFSTEALTSGIKNGAIGAFTGMTQTFTAGALNNIGVDGLTGDLFKNATTLSNTIGAIAAQGVNYAFNGDFTLNVLNLSDFTKGKVNTGLLELHLGNSGTSMNFGTGGANLSLGTIYNSLQGLEAWDATAKIIASGNAEYAIAARTLYSGSATNRQLFDELITDKARVIKDYDFDGVGETVRSDNGMKYIYLGREVLEDESRYGLGVVLSHESYRNGIDDGKIGQELERARAVIGHNNTANALTKTYGAGAIGIAALIEMINYNEAVATGNTSGISGILEKYDTSADYWKLNRDGTLLYDGLADLYDENDNIIYKSSDRRMQGSLSEILGISYGDAGALMESIGLSWTKEDGWRQSGDGIIKMNSEIQSGKTYADIYSSRKITDTHTKVNATLEQHNPINIYNALVESGMMQLTSEAAEFVRGLKNDPNKKYTLMALPEGINPFISFEEYKANNFIQNMPDVSLNTPLLNTVITTYFAATGSRAPHRGIDLRATSGTEVSAIFSNETTNATIFNSDADLISKQGYHVDLETQVSYTFKGSQVTDTIQQRMLHLSSINSNDISTITNTTVLGLSGNTGYWNGTYADHLHIDISTGVTGSPWLNYMSSQYTPQIKSSIAYDNRIYYDPMMFLQKYNYKATTDATFY
ncbi:hypothetical protein FACS1894190_01560 [Spirochaetia bacterium]|nr:hypothetical protein FACS1894190_01560 [Spirochaetia bacterium]